MPDGNHLGNSMGSHRLFDGQGKEVVSYRRVSISQRGWTI